ncbi:hypothetical protein TNCV_3426561 [Trichonephila clavipes]|nr:hypothetical protein TNCV_3426561 [Trichonephila clavipes]
MWQNFRVTSLIPHSHFQILRRCIVGKKVDTSDDGTTTLLEDLVFCVVVAYPPDDDSQHQQLAVTGTNNGQTLLQVVCLDCSTAVSKIRQHDHPCKFMYFSLLEKVRHYA